MKSSSSQLPLGTLFLVPSPLDFSCEAKMQLHDSLPKATLETASRLTHWICENAKSTRAYLKRIHEIVPLSQTLQSINIQELPHHIHKKGDHDQEALSNAASFDPRDLLKPALDGFDVGLVSDAGMPAIADPGSSIVRAAHDLGLSVVALNGPVSLMLALASSGLNGQNFAFVGYLPQENNLRILRIKELESLALKTGQTQLFIETPYRNASLQEALLKTLQSNTRLSIACGLNLHEAQTFSALTKTWKQEITKTQNRAIAAEKLAKLPAVFGIGR